jgi:ribosomal protein S18 acetylase RimI-like enzyme
MAEVTHARPSDVASWQDIVAEVEPLFGPMPDFVVHLDRGISRGTALCVLGLDGSVAGGMLLSATPGAQINWLAVRVSSRRSGNGRMLLASALEHFGRSCEVTVDTFGEDLDAGRPARRLYESFGFVASETLDRGPEGGARQRFRLSSESQPSAD